MSSQHFAFVKEWDAHRWVRRAACATILGLLGASLSAGGQVGTAGADSAGPPPAAQRGPSREAAPEQDPTRGRLQRSLEQRRDEERQKELEADTRHLLELAQSLEADVSKTNRNELSLDVIRRAEQIEKLAHSVREKMRGYY